MAVLDFRIVFLFGRFERAAVDAVLDRAEHWLESWTAPAVRVLTASLIHPRRDRRRAGPARPGGRVRGRERPVAGPVLGDRGATRLRVGPVGDLGPSARGRGHGGRKASPAARIAAGRGGAVNT